MKPISEYTIRKSGDNYALCFRGAVVEHGIFATRKTALKYKAIAEHERRERLRLSPIHRAQKMLAREYDKHLQAAIRNSRKKDK